MIVQVRNQGTKAIALQVMLNGQILDSIGEDGGRGTGQDLLL